jgi:hypothetical protein
LVSQLEHALLLAVPLEQQAALSLLSQVAQSFLAGQVQDARNRVPLAARRVMKRVISLIDLI